VIQTMTRSKLRNTLAILLAVGVALGGVAGVVRKAPRDTIVAAPAPAPKHEATITIGNVAKVRALAPIDRSVWRIVWRPDGKQFALLRWDKVVELRDAATFRSLGTIESDRKVMSFAFSPDPDVVALCAIGRKTEVRGLRAGTLVRVETGEDHAELAFSPDGKLLATANYATGAKLWETATGRLVRALDTGEQQGGLTPAFSPNGKVLALGNRNAAVRLFEVATGKLLRTLDREMSRDLRFRPDGKVLAVAYVDKSVRLWDVANGKLLREARVEGEELHTLDWSPRGDVLATAGMKSTLTLWDARRLTLLRKLEAPEWVIRVRFTPDGTRLLVAGGTRDPNRERKVYVWGLR
jgi:WD40 repeat protein